MTIYPLSGASWPAKQQSSSAMDVEAHGYALKREMQNMYPSSCRGSPRQWELRKITSFPVLDADDYWSDASLSLPHLASALPQVEPEMETASTPWFSRIEEAHRCSPPQMSSRLVKVPIKAHTRCSAFPPPLDSPANLMCEGRYPLQTVEKVCFTSVRSNGRLLVTEIPIAAQPRRHLRSQRCNGRLLLRLYVESSSTEVEEERPIAAGVKEDDPIATEGDPLAEKASTMSPSAQKANNVVVEEEDEDGGDKENGIKASLYTRVLKTLECDAFTDSTEAQLQPKYGRRSGGVASFLHKSLTRVRPLNMLTIWQS